MSYDSAVLANSPLLYYAMPAAEAGTSLADTGSGGHTGGFSGTYARGGVNLLGGGSDKSVDLGGGYITTGWNPFTGNVTVEGWARRDDTTTTDVLFGNSGDWANTVTLYCEAGASGFPGTGIILDASGAYRYGWSNVNVPAGQPFHWAFTYNAGTTVAEVFINGVSKGTSGAIGGLWPATPGNLLFGASAPDATPFNGELQKVAWYGSVLTAAQILAHYDEGMVYNTYLVRPVSDSKAEWTISTGVDCWAVLNDAVTQPTAPTVPGEYCTVSGAVSKGVGCYFAATPALQAHEYIRQIDSWAYMVVPATQTVTHEIWSSALNGIVAIGNVSNFAAGWSNVTLTANGIGELSWNYYAANYPPNGAFKITYSIGNGGSGTCTLYAVYAVVKTSLYSFLGPELVKPQSVSRLG